MTFKLNRKIGQLVSGAERLAFARGWVSPNTQHHGKRGFDAIRRHLPALEHIARPRRLIGASGGGPSTSPLGRT